MSKKTWCILCIDTNDHGWKYASQIEPLTICPNDASHSVNLDSVHIKNAYPISIPINGSTSSTNWAIIDQILFTGSVIQYVSVINILAAGIPVSGVNPTSFDIKLIRNVSGETICQINSNNVNHSWVNLDMGDISNIPEGDEVFEIMAKVNGGGSVSIKNITFMTLPE